MKKVGNWTIYHTGILSIDRIHNEELDKLAEMYFAGTGSFEFYPPESRPVFKYYPPRNIGYVLAQRKAKTTRTVQVEGKPVVIPEYDYLVKRAYFS